MMKTLAIRGAGSTGPSIVEGLLDRNHRVIILHRQNTRALDRNMVFVNRVQRERDR